MSTPSFFLKIDGVDGESTDDRHKGEIELYSWSFGSSNAASQNPGSGGGAGKVVLSDFHFVKKTDKASPRLFVASCSGEHLRSATLVCRKAGESPMEFLTVILSNVMISSFQEAGTAAADMVPTDQVSCSYSRIECRYRGQKADGSLGDEFVGGWDVLTNKKI